LSTLTNLKAAVAGVLAAVPGMGTVDLARIDPDSIPRKVRGDTPYWGLSLRGITTREGTLGADLDASPPHRQMFYTYRLRLEGWRIIVAQQEAQEAWETLVEAVVDALLLSPLQLARAVREFSDMKGAGAVSVDVAGFLNNSSRAHHAIVEADLETYRDVRAA
jgi:hypothetical protein